MAKNRMNEYDRVDLLRGWTLNSRETRMGRYVSSSLYRYDYSEKEGLVSG